MSADRFVFYSKEDLLEKDLPDWVKVMHQRFDDATDAVAYDNEERVFRFVRTLGAVVFVLTESGMSFILSKCDAKGHVLDSIEVSASLEAFDLMYTTGEWPPADYVVLPPSERD